MATIITISGKARHGKDTTAQILKEQLINQRVLIIHYADYLKYICREYFGWDGNKDEKGRQILQKVGTEKIRNINPDFHVEIISKFIDVFQSDFDFIIIPDTRFPNEIDYLRKKGYNVLTVHVERLNFESELTEEQKNHPSETALDGHKFDFYFECEDGIENITKEVVELIMFMYRRGVEFNG